VPTRVRVLVRDDLPAVAALLARATQQPAQELQGYFREMLFDNPWRGLELPSWVAEEDGRLVGFQAVVPRPMRFRGRDIRVAVGCQFLVEPGAPGLTALRLAQAFLAGPQDLTLIDGASDQVQRISAALGGTAPLAYNLHWTRLLRPLRALVSRLGARGLLPQALARAAQPLCAAPDALFARLRPNRFARADGALAESALEPAAMLEVLPEVASGHALQPVYDAGSLAWLLEQAARKRRHGTLRARAVHNGEGRLAGWYLYYLRPGGVGEVLQLAAREGCFEGVLQRALADAWRQGAAALRGRLEPRQLAPLSERHCWLRREGTWTLVHARDPELLAAVGRGDAFLSRLEGEWWMRFLGEGQPA